MVGALPLVTRKSAVSVWLLAETVSVNDLNISNVELAMHPYTFLLHCSKVALNNWNVAMSIMLKTGYDQSMISTV